MFLPLLRKLPICNSTSLNSKVAMKLKRKEWRPGQEIVKQGDVGDGGNGMGAWGWLGWWKFLGGSSCSNFRVIYID